MKNTTSSNPKTGVKVVASLLAASQVASAADSTESIESLEPTTVVATKFEKNLSDVSQSVTVLDVEQLKAEGQLSVQNALGYRVPGVVSFSAAAQRGSVGTLLIRGTTSNKSQIRLDGVRVYTESGGPNNFLGNSSLNGFSSVEVLKGAGSALYGDGAIGGIVSLTTAKGEGDIQNSASVEYGSFDSWAGSLASSGTIDRLSYNVGIFGEETKNDANSGVKGNDFNKFGYYGRFDYKLDENSSVGFTVRGMDVRYQNPFSFNAQTAGVHEKQNYDAIFTTAFYDSQVTSDLHTRVTFGYSIQDFDLTVPGGGSYTNTDRDSVYWDNLYVWSDAQETTFGGYFEHVDYVNSFAPSGGDRDTYGIYARHGIQLTEQVLVSGLLGWDDHDDYGDEFTWSTGLVVDVTDSTIFKANAGKAFRAPSFFDLTPSAGATFFGTFYPGVDVDPDLGAEQSFNWDVSLEQQVGETELKLTWFENDITNSINVSPRPGMNSLRSNAGGKTKANGIEFAVQSDLESVNSTVFATYTYYQQKQSGAIPQQSATLGVTTDFNDDLQAGIVAQWVDQRELGETVGDYTLVNANVNYTVSSSVKLHARIENIFDESYLLSDFTPFGEVASNGRGRGFYGGVTVSF